ncbi:MAG: hypothetical protein ACP6IU_00080 [Candidatus Asgardarchaeia archaeon]
MSITISKDEIKRYLKLTIISEITLLKEKTRLFEKKYGCTFLDFEKNIKTAEKERFEIWDDYIEWKAYTEKVSELKKKLKAVEHAKKIKVI